jgi:hypothetical protein
MQWETSLEEQRCIRSLCKNQGSCRETQGDLEDEIYEVYIKNDNTLEETMAAIDPKLGFTAK